MIISTSRRTDIPAFYSDWFFNRLRDGFVLVRNPFNFHQVSSIKLTEDVVDCLVFWSKNPADMILKHRDDLLKLDTPYYFQFTVNPYSQEIEPNVPTKKNIFVTFAELANLIGKDRVIWRYDPIIFTDKIDFAYHLKYFEIMAQTLAPYTNKCVISFLDFYPKIKRNMGKLNAYNPSDEEKVTLCARFLIIAKSHNLQLCACAEDLDLGVIPNSCIDPKLIEQLSSKTILAKKDENQRKACSCVESIDIGTYNSCQHYCKYCYANSNITTIEKQILTHNPNSPLLFGELTKFDKIIERNMEKLIL